MSAMSKADCVKVAAHTKEPEGYLQWHAWAEKKAKTHQQKRCPECGLWAIWVPKKAKAS